MKKYIKILIVIAVMMTLITPSAGIGRTLAEEDNITLTEENGVTDRTPAEVSDADTGKTADAEEAKSAEDNDKTDNAGKADKSDKTDNAAEADKADTGEPADKSSVKPAAAPADVSKDNKNEKADTANKAVSSDTIKENAAGAEITDDAGKYLPYTRGKCTEDPIAALERSKMTPTGRKLRLLGASKDSGLTPGETTTYTSKEIDEAAIFSAGGLNGFCGDIGQPRGTDRKASVSKLSNKSKAARVMYYYCVKKGWWDKANGEDKGKRQYDELNGMYRMAFLERMVQYAYQGQHAVDIMNKNYDPKYTVPLIIEKADKALDEVDEAPSEFKAYLLEDEDSSLQSKILVWDYSEPVDLKIKKSASEPTSLSLAGAVYYVYTDKACTKRAKDADGELIELKTKDNGESGKASLEKEGTYYVKEISAPPGFDLDKTVHEVEAKEGETAKVNSVEPVTTALYLQKQAASTTTDFIKEAPGNYTLQGAEYELYTDSACTTRAKDVSGNIITLRTKADGSTDPVLVKPGSYYAKEKTASKGFRPDTTVRGPVTVTASNTASNPAKIVSKEEPAYGDLFALRKIDKSGNNGWKKLIGAKYRISYYAIDPAATSVSGKAARSWTFKTVKKTDPKTKEPYAGIDFMKDDPVSGDAFYIEKGARILPIGVFTLEEIEAPDGIARDETVYYGKVYQPSTGAEAKTAVNTKNGKDLTFEVGNEKDVINHEKPQSVKIVIDKKSGRTEENVPDGADREHVKGSLAGAEFDVYFDNPRLAEPKKIGTIVTDEKGYGELAADVDGEDLELGRYYIEERVAPPGYVIDSVTTPEKYDVYEDGKHIINARALEKNTGVFEYTVTSKDKPHETHVYKKDIATGKEIPGATLQVFDSAGNKLDEWTSTSEPHDIIALHDETQGELKDGKYILREITAPFGYDIAEDVEFQVKSGEVENKVEMNNAPIVIRTNATDAETKTHTGTFSKEEKIIDKVSFENLYAGREYTFKGILMDKDTKQPLKDKDGNEVTSERTCKFDENGNILDGEYTGPKVARVSGSVDLEFTVDASEFMKEKTVIAFEDIYREEKKIAMHADLSDKDQTIRYGGIVKTVAVDKKSGSRNVLAEDNAVVIDKVEYRNLVEGEIYTIEGVLYDKTTGNRTVVTGKKTFTAEKSNGTVNVEFRFNAAGVRNHDFVVFETLKSNGVEIDRHEDPDDEDQTVHVPEIRTTATDLKTGDHIAYGGKTVKVKDTVLYRNLIPGKEYEMSGILMNKRTGKPVTSEGKAVTAVKKFTPASKDGSVELIFTFNGVDLRGDTVVAFEKCRTNKVPVAVHADISDRAQSINIPKIGTEANLAKAHKEVFDLVSYENLKPGKYIMRGWLMDKKTGKMVEDSGGETEFTVPEKGPYAGAVTVDLPVKNYSRLSGHRLVAYEELYYIVPGTDDEEEREELAADHKDLSDRDQTVTIPGGPSPKTGDDNMLKFYAVITVMAAAELILIYAGRRVSDRRRR